MIEFERLVILFNPASTNAAKAERQIQQLESAFSGKVIKANVGKDHAATCKILKEHLRPGDILVPAGGDGTINNVINCLLSPSMSKEIRNTRVLPLGAGRMNDIPRMLNRRYYNDPRYVLENGRELSVNPMHCTITPFDKSKKPLEVITIHSIGFGFGAESSKLYNDPEFRAKQQQRSAIAQEVELFRAAVEILKEAKPLEITVNGQKRQVFDVTAVCGHIMAGYYRLPSRLSQKEFFFEISDDKSFAHTVKTIAELMTNRYSGGELATSVSFDLHTPAAAHIGGEPFTPPSPCKVEIKTHSQPLKVIATSPKA